MREIDPRKVLAHPLTPLVAAVVLTAMAYANALGGEFVFDDLFLVKDAKYIRSFEAFGRTLTTMGSPEGAGYRPLRTFTHVLEYQVFGLRPWGYHLTNLCLHVLICVLIFFLARRLGLSRLASLAGMAVFAVHPVHTEAVTYISGRRDLLYAVFYVAGMLTYIKGVQENRRTLVLATLLLYGLSVFSKETGITLPAVLYLWDVLVHSSKERSWWRRLVDPMRSQPVFWGILWAGALAFFLYRGVLVPRTLNPSWWGQSMVTNFATVFAVHGRYLAVQIWPVDLQADYTLNAFALARSFADPRTVVSMIIVALTLVLAALMVRTAPLATLGVLAYWVMLLPVSHIIPHHELAAEHHLYVASTGLCLALGAGVVALGRRHRWAGLSAGVALLVAFIALTLARNEDWRTEEALWADTVARAPDCARANLNLAAIRLDQGRLDEAEAMLRRSLRNVDYPRSRAYLGTIYTRRGEYEHADRILSSAYRRYPEDRMVIRYYALNLRSMGKEKQARKILRQGLTKHPKDPHLHFLMAGSYVMSDMPEQALESYLEVLRYNPADEDSRLAAITIARALGRTDVLRSLEGHSPP